MVKNLPAMQETWVQSLGWKIPWRRKWLPIPVFLPGKSHRQRNLGGYSPWDHKELDTTEQLTHIPKANLMQTVYDIKERNCLWLAILREGSYPPWPTSNWKHNLEDRFRKWTMDQNKKQTPKSYHLWGLSHVLQLPWFPWCRWRNQDSEWGLLVQYHIAKAPWS